MEQIQLCCSPIDHRISTDLARGYIAELVQPTNSRSLLVLFHGASARVLPQQLTEDSVHLAIDPRTLSSLFADYQRPYRGVHGGRRRPGLARTCPSSNSSLSLDRSASPRVRPQQQPSTASRGCDIIRRPLDYLLLFPLDLYPTSRGYYNFFASTPRVPGPLRACTDARALPRQVVSSSLRGPVYACVLHMCVLVAVCLEICLCVCVCVCLSVCLNECVYSRFIS